MNPLLVAAKPVAKWLRWWIDQDACDCDGDHHCGKPERRRELEALELEIKKAEGQSSNVLNLSEISERLRTQDNRCTSNPMFQLRIKVREVGFDANYSDNFVWFNPHTMECVYDDDPGFKGKPRGNWFASYYKDHWETVMVAFTEQGLKEYMEQDGHNVMRRAFRGEWEIYVDSFNRCPEMIAIREELLNPKDEILKLREALDAIANMPEYDQDDAHRLRNIAKKALLAEMKM